ncbi:MAG TPA: MlaD family protein [Pseudolabrys sp.]|jgi:phospholipid/cholesterol/gamma-HCH transport system substrate-binding protein|nr:MlaD family protein [Pseudolabrys sp.]
METKANYTLVGMFTLAVVAAIFGFVYWAQHVGGTGERAIYRVLFSTSVSGLRTGSAVLFNGIRVGDVTDLRLNADNPNQVAATISVDKNVKVRPDTRAGIEFQGLTGIAAIALNGGSPGEPALNGLSNPPPALVASPAASQDIAQGARDVLQRMDDFIEENRPAFKSTLKNLDTFSGALARNSARLDTILAGMQNFMGGADGKGGDINDAAKSIRELSDRLSKLADNLDKRTASITDGINDLTATGTKQINAVSRDLQRTLGTIDRTVNNIDKNPSRLLFGGSGGGSQGGGR